MRSEEPAIIKHNQYPKVNSRLRGIELLLLIPIAFCSPVVCASIVLLTKNDGRCALRAFIIALCAGVAFYGMRLDSSNDIARHMSLLSNYSDLELWECFGASHYAFLPVWDIWCWLVAKANNPYLLQCTAAFIGYFIICYVAFDYSYNHHFSHAGTVLALIALICAVPTLPLVAGIRSSVAVLITGLAFYLYIEHGISVIACFALMAAGLMIHPVALFPAIIAVLISILPFRRPILTAGLAFILMLFIAIIVEFAIQYIPTNNSIGLFLFESMRSLLLYHEGNSWTAAQASSLNTRMNNYVTISLIIVAMVVLIKSTGKNEESSKNPYILTLFALLCTATSLALMLVIPVNGTRYLPSAYLIGIPIVIGSIEKNWNISRGDTFFVSTILAILLLASLALHIYSINYGLLDFVSFASTALIGILGVSV